MNEKLNECGLLNFEGNVLTAKKIGFDSFKITDQYREIVSILDTTQLIEFLDGERELVDSKGKSWNYIKESRGAKPSHRKLIDLIMFVDFEKWTRARK